MSGQSQDKNIEMEIKHDLQNRSLLNLNSCIHIYAHSCLKPLSMMTATISKTQVQILN